VNYRLELSPKAVKFLDGLTDKLTDKLIEKFDETFTKLQTNPFHSEELQIKKLSGFKKDYRLRIGQLRILYTIY